MVGILNKLHSKIRGPNNRSIYTPVIWSAYSKAPTISIMRC